MSPKEAVLPLTFGASAIPMLKQERQWRWHDLVLFHREVAIGTEIITSPAVHCSPWHPCSFAPTKL